MNTMADVISLDRFRTAQRRGKPQAGTTIAFTGGKGGVGKSFVAANASVWMARNELRTLTVDGDFSMADLNLLFGLAPERSVLDLLRGMPVENVLERAHGIDLLPGLNGNSMLANLDPAQAASIYVEIETLRDRYEATIIDAPTGLSDVGIEMCALASHVVLVLSPEPTSLADAYACLKALTARVGLDRAFVVVNRVDSASDAHDAFTRLEALVSRFLGVELCELPFIPADARAATACALGSPVLLQYPDAPASRALCSMLSTMSSMAPSTFTHDAFVIPGPEDFTRAEVMEDVR